MFDLIAIILFGLPFALANFRLPAEQLEGLLGNGDDLAGRLGYDVEGQALREALLGEVITRGVTSHH